MAFHLKALNMSIPKLPIPQPFITAFWMQDQDGLLHTQEQPLIEIKEYANMVRSFLTNAILITDTATYHGAVFQQLVKEHPELIVLMLEMPDYRKPIPNVFYFSDYDEMADAARTFGIENPDRRVVLTGDEMLFLFSNEDHVTRHALVLTTYPKPMALSWHRSTVINENMQLVVKSEILRADSPKKIRYFTQTFSPKKIQDFNQTFK